MKKLKYFCKLLNTKTPFAIARFNDGEMGAILKNMTIISRGDQPINNELSKKLKKALTHKQHNYFVGLPHKQKYPKYYHIAKNMVGDYKYLTSSVIFHVDNWIPAIKQITKHAQSFNPITWVGNENHNLSNIPINITTHIKVNAQNAWDSYIKVRDYEPKDKELILISAGPLGRVLTKEWFQRNPRCFILEIGSIFDPWTRNVQHQYQMKRIQNATFS